MITPRQVCILGPTGRMGRALLDAAAKRKDIAIASTVDQDQPMTLGKSEVYVDFTTPAATRQWATLAHETRTAAVIGTTGLDDAARTAIDRLVEVAPVVVAANFSLGVNLVLGLVKQAAAILGPDWDAEVVETHHHHKRDAPSGTALAIAKSIAAGHGSNYDDVKRHTRDGDVGPRPRGEIGVATVRGGDIVGEHMATFFGDGERVEIGHRATSRAIFALGALRAAAWVVGKPPGRYDMLDVLGLSG